MKTVKLYASEIATFRKRGKLTCAICAVVLGATFVLGLATRSDAAEFIQNGGFEGAATQDGASIVPNGWNPNPGYTGFGFNMVTDNPNHVYDGTYSLQIGNYTYEPVPSLSQTFADKAGSPYSGTLYISYGGAPTTDTQGSFQVLLDSTVVVSLDYTAPGAFKEYSFSFFGSGSDTLTIQGNTNPGEWFVDDVSVTGSSIGAVPESSTWAMLILGFAGIGFMAYRRKSKPALMAA